MLMKRCLAIGCFALFLGLIAMTGSACSAPTADAPFVGTWKMTVLLPGQDIALFLVEIKTADEKTEGKILSAGIPALAADAKVESIKVDGDKSLTMVVHGGPLTLPVAVHNPKGESKPDKLLASTEISGQRHFIVLERTTDKEIDAAKARVTNPHAKPYDVATSTVDAKDKQKALKDFLGTKDLEPSLAYAAGLEMLAMMAENGVEKEEAVKQADETVKLAAAYGPEMKTTALQQAAKKLAASEKLAPVAVDLARDAEKNLDKNTPVSLQIAVLSTLKSALQKSGKTTEAKDLSAKIAKLDEQLDQEFLKDAVPFKTEEITRKEKGDRVVLVELFTGAQCPPCVAADVAFDGMLKSYKATDVVFLQYHLHIPGPDALTNEDSVKRFDFYTGRETQKGTPTYFLDGVKGPGVGGGKADGKGAFQTLNKSLEDALEVGAQGKIELSATNKDGKMDIHVEVSKLSKAGDFIKLRLVLVEEVARYPGSNGQRLHHHVVRAFPGGVDGIALKQKSSKHDVRVNLDDVKKSLSDYLANYKGHKFEEDERPLDLKHLKIVAFVQNDDGDHDVFQAAQIDVPESK
jgi:hypothetical protein